MNQLLNDTTRDPNEGRLKLRSDLIFVPQTYAGKCHVHIEIGSQSKFFRVGFDEYVFLSLFDGRTSFAEALTIVARKLGANAFTHAQAMHVFEWAIDNGLGELVDLPSESLTDADESDRGSGLAGKLNPFSMRFKLLEPDDWIQRSLAYTRWMFHWSATVVVVVLVGAAIGLILKEWDRFSLAASQVFAPQNWAVMAACWVGLKIVHELGHAICCRAYGGRVGDMGVLFILFAPLAYVDVTSSWRFSSRWQRIHVALAGIQLEAFVAALATFAWHYTESPVWSHWLYNLILMSGVTTILFNINPLMRFDGYFVLSDLIGHPNLYQDASRSVKQALSRLFFNARRARISKHGRNQCVVFAYGIACTLWRVLICAALFIAAAAMFHGAGIILAFVGLATWLGRPLRSLFAQLTTAWQERPSNLVRFVCVSATIVFVSFAVLRFVPSPMNEATPGVVDYRDLKIVRSEAPGFVEEVFVADNQSVDKGQLLFRLSNRELETEVEELRLEIRQTETRSAIALSNRETSIAQIQQARLEALTKILAEKLQQLQELDVVAPVSGQLLGRRLGDLQGTFVTDGQELCAIGDPNAMELVLSVSHEQHQESLAYLGEAVRVRVGQRGALNGRLIRVEPKATTKVSHPALLSTAGGPLIGVHDENAESGEEQVLLANPRFKAVVALTSSESISLACGERGYAIIGRHHQSIGEHLYSTVHRWFEDKWETAHH